MQERRFMVNLRSCYTAALAVFCSILAWRLSLTPMVRRLSPSMSFRSMSMLCTLSVGSAPWASQCLMRSSLRTVCLVLGSFQPRFSKTLPHGSRPRSVTIRRNTGCFFFPTLLNLIRNIILIGGAIVPRKQWPQCTRPTQKRQPRLLVRSGVQRSSGSGQGLVKNGNSGRVDHRLFPDESLCPQPSQRFHEG